MKELWGCVVTRWGLLTPAQRRTFNAMTLLVAGYLAHYLVFTIAQPFYIEDCAISFSYARNLIEGEGLVPFPGAERVEGYSNPLWVFLIAFFLLVKVPVWTSAKILGAVFGAICLPLAWALCRRARGGRDDMINLLPPFLLAASTQFVIWNASGLENSLFCVLLAGAMYRTVREGTEGGRPWSAFLYFLLAITRPEGVAYAVVGVSLRLVYAISQRRVVLPMLAWLATFTVPLVLYHWWRFDYFGWPFPNTYYAKMGASTRFKPLDWNIRGWKYLNGYLVEYWIAFASPLFFLAAAGLRRWRGALALFLLAGFGVFVLWDGKVGFLNDVDFWKPVARHWLHARVWWIFGSAAILGLMTLGRSGWKALSMIWATFCGVMLYIIYTGGDWMDAYRWPNFLTVPMFLLIGLGLGELVDLLPWMKVRLCRRLPLRNLVMAVGAIVIALPNAWGSYHFTVNPETGVRDVNRRVDYMKWVQHRLHVDDILLVDVDMGAHLWNSGWQILDVAGLVDIPMGHHDYEKAFIQEYIFDEHRPDFIHSHGGWARRTRINNFQEFKDHFIEIPGYPVGGRTLHLGNHVDKRHWVASQYGGPDGRRVPLTNGVTLDGWEVPSPIVPTGGKFFIETWFRSGTFKSGLRVLVFITDGKDHLSVQELAPGYDWYPPKDWAADEFIFSGFDLAIPADFPTGEYQMGLVVLNQKTGKTMRPATPEELAADSIPSDPEQAEAEDGVQEADTDDGAGEEDAEEEMERKPILPRKKKDADDDAPSPKPQRLRPPEEALPALAPYNSSTGPVFMQGEILLPVTLTIVSRDDATAEAEHDLQRALQLAANSACEEAWQAWWDARRHVVRNTRWHNEHDGEVRYAMAGCWATRAEAASDTDERAAHLIHALFWDHQHPTVLATARPLALVLKEKGEEQMEQEDWEAAYHTLQTAVTLDPRLSETRRDVEDCRDQRLNIEGKGHRTFLDSFINKSRKAAKADPKGQKGRGAQKPRPVVGPATDINEPAGDTPEDPAEAAQPAADRPRPRGPPVKRKTAATPADLPAAEK